MSVDIKIELDEENYKLAKIEFDKLISKSPEHVPKSLKC